MIPVTLQLYRDEDDYEAFATAMPVVPRVKDVIDAKGKFYAVESVAHVLDDEGWTITVWTEPSK